ncbi:MAG: hypothetical protein IE880_01900 [Epsilonproteobacteria bacterium]|nr:hypothetical protein [Campylobacterota bacterium]
MKILSVGKHIEFQNLEIVYTSLGNINSIENISEYDYILVTGGDGTIRRTLKDIYHKFETSLIPPFIINPTGSFNVVAKIHRLQSFDKILSSISNNEHIKNITIPFYAIDKKIFLFSCGNSSDVAHIFLSEVLRFGFLKTGLLRYIITSMLLLPFHLLATPFLLFSKSRFFVFTPLKFKRFFNIYGQINDSIEIDLKNYYNVLEFDGDLSVVKKQKIVIKKVGNISLATI